MDLNVYVAPGELGRVSIPGTDLAIIFTNSFLTMILVMGVMLIGGVMIVRRATLVPNHLQACFEVIVEFLLNIVESAAGKSYARKIFPLIGGAFLFILFANYSGLLPGMKTVYFEGFSGDREGVLLFRAPTADLNMTLAMALVTFFAVQVAGVSSHGVGGRLKHMATGPWWLAWLLFLIEVVSELSRIVSLSFRLFGNIFAGEVLLGVMYTITNAIKISVIGLVIPVIFIYVEVLFGAIQALVFALLTMIYIVLAAAHDDDHGDAESHHGDSESEAQKGTTSPASASGD
ncbi:MAG: ATP synthase F0 subunit A [Sphaerobacteraceae bacterium]|nr:MAG: ATP synthase F0 subunit A [Sphaerobacteraceae bacterium]